MAFRSLLALRRRDLLIGATTLALLVAAAAVWVFGDGTRASVAAAADRGAAAPILAGGSDLVGQTLEVELPGPVADTFSLQYWLDPGDCEGTGLTISVAFDNGLNAVWRRNGRRLQYTEGGQDDARLETVCAPRWRHLAIVREAEQATLYVDGAFLDRIALETVPNAPAREAAVTFGGEGRWRFAGLALYSRALSAEEVALHAREKPSRPWLATGLLLVAAVAMPLASRPKGRRALVWTVGGVALALVAGETVTRLAATANLLDARFLALMARAQKGDPWQRGEFALRDTKTVAPPADAYAHGERYYRNIPSVRALWYELVPYTHDQHGFRALAPVSRWPEAPRPEGPVRIAVIGDSMTYGAGVENDQTFPAVAQRWLDRWAPGRFVVINAGVPGFSIQHLEPFYRNHLKRFALEHIVHAVFLPDFSRQQVYQKPGDPTYYLPESGDARWKRWLRPSYFASFVAYGLAIVEHTHGSEPDERLERLRSFDALKRLSAGIAADGTGLSAYLLPHELVPEAESADTPMTDVSWLDRQFADVASLYQRRGSPVVPAYAFLEGYTTGQCFEFGRRNHPGHYSVVCNAVLGRALAAHLYETIIGRPPPEDAGPEMPRTREIADRPEPPLMEPLRLEVAGEAIDLVPVPAGTVTMGEPQQAPEVTPDEAPRPAEVAKPFFIMRHEVTNALWNLYAGRTGRSDVLGPHRQGAIDLGRPDLPRPYVSRNDAELFAAWLSEETGAAFRLPAEAEWEWAAKLGLAAARPLGEVAVYDVDAAPHPPCARGADRLGLCDMLGNFAEVAVPEGRDEAVFKGGSYAGGPLRLRPASRRLAYADRRFSHVGLRLVAEIRVPASDGQ